MIEPTLSGWELIGRYAEPWVLAGVKKRCQCGHTQLIPAGPGRKVGFEFTLTRRHSGVHLTVSPMTRSRVQWAGCLGPTSAPLHPAHFCVRRRLDPARL